MTKKATKFSKQDKIDELWRRGVLTPWLGHAVQQRMAAAIAASPSKKYVINSARRLGKSFLLCMLAIERALQQPNAQIKYACDTQRAAKRIVVPLFRQILETCPKVLRPKFKSHDLVYEFPNGSQIAIAGVTLDQADSLRGTSCDLAIIDEAGFIESEQLSYLVESILMPQMLTRPNSRLIMASTPPKTPDHSFVQKYMQQAMHDNAYSRFQIYDNPLLTPEIIEEFKREAGGEDSTTWRREYLAEVVTETENAIFPEATVEGVLDKLIVDVPRPSHFIPITVVDLGYIDFTGILFGYFHFGLGKIVIEDEILVNKATSAEIVGLIKAKEKELWGTITPRLRVVDGPALVVADLNQTHRFNCRPPDKSDLTANVNRVRIDLAQERLLVHPRCTKLVTQMRYAVWDKTRTTFARTSSGGHSDLVAALIYLAKHIDRQTNPVPAGWGFDAFNDWGFPRTRKNTAAEQFRALFPFTRQKPDR
jgi:hypothetical protein